jgi:hypothetical protein
VSSNIVAGKQFCREQGNDDVRCFLSWDAFPFCDEKKLAVWKYQMESIFFTIGCLILGIARGDAKKKRTKQLGLSPEEIAKRKRFNKKFVEKRNLGFNLLVQSMGMNAMYQSVISTTSEIGDLFGAWNAIWDKYYSKKLAMQSQLATEFANCFQMPDEPMETFLNKINEICARMFTDPGDDMKKAQVVKGVIDDFIHLQHKKPKRFRRGAIFAQA